MKNGSNGFSSRGRIRPHRIRVEFHVAWLGHALPCVHLLDASPQVVPYLVQAYLSQSVGVLGPVWRHREARRVLASRCRSMPSSCPAPVSVGPPRLLSSVDFCPDSLCSQSAQSIWQRRFGKLVVGCETGCSPTLHAWVALSATPPPKSFGTPHQMTYKGKYIFIINLWFSFVVVRIRF